MGTSAWRPLAVARGGKFTPVTGRARHREGPEGRRLPPRNKAMCCRPEATETKRCAVGQTLAMYGRFALNLISFSIWSAAIFAALDVFFAPLRDARSGCFVKT